MLSWVHALRGDEAEFDVYAGDTRRRAQALGFRLYEFLVSLCQALLDLGAGRVDEAIDALEEVARYADDREVYVPGVAPQLELAEAYVRAGRDADAEAILDRFEQSQLSSVAFLAALAERCRGLAADAGRFDAHFATALSRHEATECPFAQARTELCYGERLRRARRRAEARPYLRSATRTFDRLGAAPWAERAAAELEASGVRAEHEAPPALAELTPHELRIAAVVASGATNREIAARLFVTPKTVEYHLRSIYRKLRIRSRSELVRLHLADEPRRTTTA